MKFRAFTVAAILLAGLVAPSSAQTSERHWFADGAVPSRYEISLTPDGEAGTFAGQVAITVETEESLPAITMNALDIEVTRATINNSAVTVTTDAEAQTITLTPRRALRAGTHVIRITYNGKIYDDAYGLFRVSYQAGGETKRILATQFEPADARRLLPMWDQPNRRAVFSMTVTHPTDQMAVSNMPIASARALSGGLTRTTFQDTPSMASYLLFLAVGDFERVTTDVDGIELGVVVRRGEGHRTAEALRAGTESLRYYHEYFGIEYPLPKLDMIGVPGAGGFGAMENWGAILYFDQYLLVDSDRSSERDRQFVFSVVAHEIAHQWFGNLVTMQWWDDLWLNEGFASWMAAKAVEEIHPDWQPWMAQQAGGTADAMGLDARVGTHPIVQTVNTIDEANLAFDDITYDKGLAVLRMLEAYVGEEGFRQGVRDYLNAHLYGNARTEELWAAVQGASGQPVLDIARNFTGQVGFPILSVSGADCRREASNGVINITQRRFALDDVSRTNETWAAPIVAQRVGAEPVRAVLARTGASTVDVGSCGTYLVNAGQSGYFRVQYDRANFDRLVRDFGTLSSNDQLGLLLDYWAFGQSGDGEFTDYLELAQAAPADAHPYVQAHVAQSLTTLAGYARGRSSEPQLRAYARARISPMLERLGWDTRPSDNSATILLRAQLITALGGLGDEAVIAEARRRVNANDPALLPAGIRDSVYGIYAATASTAEYEATLQRARSATDFVEQRRAWLALASARDEALAQRTLQMVLGEDIPRQIRPQVLDGVATAHPQLGWDFLVANRAAMEGLLDPLSRLEYPAEVAASSSDPAIADALEQYASNFPAGALPQIQGTASSIRLKSRVIEQRMPATEQWVGRRSATQRGR